MRNLGSLYSLEHSICLRLLKLFDYGWSGNIVAASPSPNITHPSEL